MIRKKSPSSMNEQKNRIINFLMRDSWKNGAPSKNVRCKVLEKVKKIESIYNRYVDNIYNIHKIDRWFGSVEESDNVWFNAYHTNKEYMNN